ncbi:MAG: hypothetical protein V3W31_05285 [Thermodesulfobacteriota bacterium]
MRRVLPAIFLSLGWALLVGMGGTPDTDIPTPEVDFRVTVIDGQGISTRCSGVSWKGKTFFTATRGKGTVTIPFEKVKKVTSAGEADDDKIDFRIMLIGGDVVAVTFDADAKLYGKTSFGTYRIEARNIKEVVFE